MKKVNQQKNPKKRKNKKNQTTLNDLFTYKNDKETFIESFSMLLESGVEIISALESIKLEMKSPKMRYALDKMQENLSNGTSLSYALDQSNIINKNSLALIRIGEKSGKLNENLKIVISKEKKEKEFKSKVKSAMLYPIIVLTVTILVGVVTTWIVLPKLSTVFKQLKVDLPLSTSILLKFGDFIQAYGVIFFPSVIIVLIIIVYVLFFNTKTKHYGYDFLLKVPIIKDLLKDVELSRFGYFLGSLSDAGIPLPEAIISLEVSTESRVFKNFYISLREGIINGLSFKNIFESNPKSEKIIPQPIQQMVVAGENSGKLSNTLIKIGDKYESKIDYYAKNMSSILEPVLLVFVWIGVVFVAASVILPIYSLVGNLNDPIEPVKSQPAVNTTVEDNTESNTQENVDENSDNGNTIMEETLEKSEENLENNEGTENQTGITVEESTVIEETTTPDKQQTAETTEAMEITEENQTSDEKKIQISNTSVGYLNVRETPSLNSNVLTRVTPGDQFIVQEENESWYKIEYDEFLFGWVFKSYTSLVE